MSRMKERDKAVRKYQPEFQKILDSLKALHTKFCVETGFCGSTLCGRIKDAEITLELICDNSPTELQKYNC